MTSRIPLDFGGELLVLFVVILIKDLSKSGGLGPAGRGRQETLAEQLILLTSPDEVLPEALTSEYLPPTNQQSN